MTIRFEPKARITPTGMTLIELLVVISIMSVMAVLLIPQIRAVTKGRGIREAGRTVGAALNEASLRARSDGFAGVTFVRNTNVYRDVNSGGKVFYSSNTLYQLRRTPPYTGNTDGSAIEIVNPSAPITLRIDRPYSQHLSDQLLKDALFFKIPGYSTKIYVNPTLTAIDTDPTKLIFTLQPGLDLPNDLNGRAFQLHRAPRVDLSTKTQLPPGYHINLNYSGQLDLDSGTGGADLDENTWTTFSQNVGTPASALPAVILFDESGSVDLVLPNAYVGGFSGEPLFMCICEDRIVDSFAPATMLPRSYTKNATDVLNNPELQWLIVNNQLGTTTLVESAPPVTAINPGNIGPNQVTRILESLRISGSRQVSAQ